MKQHTITSENVRELFEYDDLGGHLTWKVFTNARAPIGSRTGTIKKRGYRQFKFKGRDYYEHLVIWLWQYGSWPENKVDHIDRDRSNNRLTNLRSATDSQNQCNTPIRSDNTSGFKGVVWDKSRCKWKAIVQYEGIIKSRRFDLFEDACEQANNWRRELHYEFAS